MENLKEFRALIKKYRSITIDEIKGKAEDLWDGRKILNKLTGFGSFASCSLCQAVTTCATCVYMDRTGYKCLNGINWLTYDGIWIASNPDELHNAINARADYMETILNKINF